MLVLRAWLATIAYYRKYTDHASSEPGEPPCTVAGLPGTTVACDFADWEVRISSIMWPCLPDETERSAISWHHIFDHVCHIMILCH